MHLSRNILLAAALTALAAGSAFACPHHGPRATGLDSRSVLSSVPQRVSNARAAALVAWKPRAWTLVAPSQAQGMRVAIDPVDGAMGMPSPDQLSQEQLVIGDDAPVSVERSANGTITAHLDDRWADFAVATIGSDGKPGWTCVPGRKAAVKFMQNPVPPVAPVAPKWEEK
ncbi:MAG TPA: hypothetical protein VI504_09255 [Candidatus Eisenbacteria bacterium]|jgi:hypothetical protein